MFNFQKFQILFFILIFILNNCELFKINTTSKEEYIKIYNGFLDNNNLKPGNEKKLFVKIKSFFDDFRKQINAYTRKITTTPWSFRCENKAFVMYILHDPYIKFAVQYLENHKKVKNVDTNKTFDEMVENPQTFKDEYHNCLVTFFRLLLKTYEELEKDDTNNSEHGVLWNQIQGLEYLSHFLCGTFRIKNISTKELISFLSFLYRILEISVYKSGTKFIEKSFDDFIKNKKNVNKINFLNNEDKIFVNISENMSSTIEEYLEQNKVFTLWDEFIQFLTPEYHNSCDEIIAKYKKTDFEQKNESFKNFFKFFLKEIELYFKIAKENPQLEEYSSHSFLFLEIKSFEETKKSIDLFFKRKCKNEKVENEDDDDDENDKVSLIDFLKNQFPSYYSCFFDDNFDLKKIDFEEPEDEQGKKVINDYNEYVEIFFKDFKLNFEKKINSEKKNTLNCDKTKLVKEDFPIFREEIKEKYILFG